MASMPPPVPPAPATVPTNPNASPSAPSAPGTSATAPPATAHVPNAPPSTAPGAPSLPPITTQTDTHASTPSITTVPPTPASAAPASASALPTPAASAPVAIPDPTPTAQPTQLTPSPQDSPQRSQKQPQQQQQQQQQSQPHPQQLSGWHPPPPAKPATTPSKSRHRASSSTSIAAGMAAGIVAAISGRTTGSSGSALSAPGSPRIVPTAPMTTSPKPMAMEIGNGPPDSMSAPTDTPPNPSTASHTTGPPTIAPIPNASTNAGSLPNPATCTNNGSPSAPKITPFAIPPPLAAGVPMLKVSSKKIKPVNVKLSHTAITWPSLKGGKVEIKSIRELRLGQSPTDTYAYDSARWITIVYVRDKQWKVVHFIARTDDVYALWVKALHELVSETSDKVVNGAEGQPGSDPELLFIRQLWPAGATAIDKQTAAGLCAQLGLVVPPPIVAQYEFPLDLATFRQLVRDVQTRPELGEIYQHLGANLSRDRVCQFLRDVQGEGNTGMDLDAVFQRYADQATGQWTPESLAAYFASADNRPNCTQDFTRPLPEYFIASSHNTYLVADQWRGSSTVEGYIRVLLAGCRSVEIDCHDGGADGPIVYHGMTITSSVPVRDVCQAINKYGFVASPYPIIISLEIRCSLEQQDKLASIIRESFGARLVAEPIDVDHMTKVPSPENLKGRILIKTKPMPQPASPVQQLSSSPPASYPTLAPPATASSPPTYQSANVDSTTDSTTESDSSFVRLARRLSMNSGPSAKTPQGHARALTDLPIYTAAVKYKGFSKLVTYDFNHMFSVSERTAQRILKDGQGADWAKHNFTHLTRVYPKGVRLTSSNFDPRPFWLAGAQLVAINYQTQDLGSLYNDALFHAGGYVLKPISLRQKVAEVTQRYRLRLKIISAQRLPPMADLHVEVTIGEETYRTKSTKGASLTPRWNEEMTFVVETKPSLLGLTFIHAEIRGSKGIVAQWTRPLSDTGRGYRYLPLSDRDRMRYLFATLFVRIDVEPLVSKPPAAAKPKLSPSLAMAYVADLL